MKKGVKIAAILVGAVAVAVIVLFAVSPLATSKKAEAKLSEFLAEGGISEDSWSIDRAYYIPLLNHLVVEKIEISENGDTFLEAEKAILNLDTSRENILAGSIEAQGISFLADNGEITAKSLSVNDFSIDRALFENSPDEAIEKLGNIRLSGMVFRQGGRTYFSLGKFIADIDYTKGKITRSTSVSFKDLALDLRPFTDLPKLRPEYRFSDITLKNSLSNGISMVNFTIDGTNLFTLKTDIGISLPSEIISGNITNFDLADFYEDMMMDSFSLTYTDKSLLDHLFELAELPGDRASIAEQLSETYLELAIMTGIDGERFVNEVSQFIIKPEKFTLKANLDAPISYEEIIDNPFALNLSLSINGGKPFTTGGL